MAGIDYQSLIKNLRGIEIERPNRSINGTLSGHAAGEPFEKEVYRLLKKSYPSMVFKQYEYLNDLFLKHPKAISVEDRNALFNSPTVMYLLSRGDKAITGWTPLQMFEEKQNDTADILFHSKDYFDIIDVKTRNMSKKAMPPNIISAYKLAKMCAYMIDNNEYENLDIHYVEIEWKEDNDILRCENACYADLFKASPKELYINWAAAMQIQFHVSELGQGYRGTKEEWAYLYIKAFVESAKDRCEKMMKNYVEPFMKYIRE